MSSLEHWKKMLPIIQAFVDGQTVQYKTAEGAVWEDLDSDEAGFEGIADYYRVKPKEEYRPFSSLEESWDEMLKHEPLGWVKSKTRDANKYIYHVGNDNDGKVWFTTAGFSGIERFSAKQMLDYFEFIDSSIFGVRED